MNEEEKNKKIEEVFKALEKSNFRSKFHLKKEDKEYIDKKGIEVIKNHAYDLIGKRLAPKDIINDGRQTPMKGHPVFIAQHATGTCCRGCLYKWHNIPKGHDLSQEELDYVVNIIMKFITKEYNS